MTNVVIHPELARIIARAINDRSVASDMISTVINRKEYKHGDFEFWREQHIEATRALDALGINVHSYDKDPREAFK